MRRRLLFCFVAATLLCVAGCKTSGGQRAEKTESLTDREEPVPGFFNEIPADTWYVVTGLEPTPKKVYESLLSDTQSPMTDFYKSYLNLLTRGTNDENKLVKALLEEFRDNLSPEGMKELGFTTEPYFAIYGLGPVPVMRLSLGDTDKFKAFLNRVESEGEVDPKVKQVGKTSYRLYQPDDDLRVPLVIRDGAVLVSMTPPEGLETIRPYLLGKKSPGSSLADRSVLQRIQKQYKFEPFSLGYVDTSRVIRVMSGVEEASGVNGKVLEALGTDIAELTPTCETEIAGMADLVPRMVMGTTIYTRETTELLFGVETPDEFANNFEAATRPLPGLDSKIFEEALFALGMGVNVDEFLNFTRARAQTVADEPFKCEKLDEFNEMAGDWLNATGNVPAGIVGVEGATVVIDDLSFGSRFTDLENVRALTLMRSGNPQALIGQFQSSVPGLSQVNLKDDGVPVPLEQLGAMLPMLKAPHIALSGQILGFSVGVGMQDEMAVLLENPAPKGKDAVAGAVSYNFRKIYDSIPRQFRQIFTRMMGTGASKDTGEMGFSAQGRLEVTGEGIYGRFRTTMRDKDDNGGGADGASKEN